MDFVKYSPNIQSPRDANHIDIEREAEILYWTGKFICSREALEAAVRKVGPSAEAVIAHLDSFQQLGHGEPNRR